MDDAMSSGVAWLQMMISAPQTILRRTTNRIGRSISSSLMAEIGAADVLDEMIAKERLNGGKERATEVRVGVFSF